VDDYLNHISEAGFERIAWNEYVADERLVEELPCAAKYLGRRRLLLIRAAK
jgi:hypothetical protein